MARPKSLGCSSSPNHLSAGSKKPATPRVELIPKRATSVLASTSLSWNRLFANRGITRTLLKKRPTPSRTGSGAINEYPLATGRSTQSSSLRLKVNIGSLKPDKGSEKKPWLFSPGGGCAAAADWAAGFCENGATSALIAGVANETTASSDDASIVHST